MGELYGKKLAGLRALGAGLDLVLEHQAGDDEAKAKEGIRRQIAFFTELGMPTSLGQLDSGVLKESTIKDLADQVTAKGTKTVGNFHPIDWKAAVDIYTMANH